MRGTRVGRPEDGQEVAGRPCLRDFSVRFRPWSRLVSRAEPRSGSEWLMKFITHPGKVVKELHELLCPSGRPGPKHRDRDRAAVPPPDVPGHLCSARGALAGRHPLQPATAWIEARPGLGGEAPRPGPPAS